MTIKRGKKSLGDLTVVKLTGARVAPPEHLTPPQRSEWVDIVQSLPADSFRPGDIPLLGAFCVASALYKEAAAMIQAEGIVDAGLTERRTDTDGTVTEKFGRRFAHPAKDILTSQGASIAQMAVKLRLCPSARYTEKTAATKAGSKASGARPWDKTGTE